MEAIKNIAQVTSLAIFAIGLVLQVVMAAAFLGNGEVLTAVLTILMSIPSYVAIDAIHTARKVN